jgi:hypothetical protein
MREPLLNPKMVRGRVIVLITTTHHTDHDDDEHDHDDTTRVQSSSFRTLAPGAWHHAATAGAKTVAGGRREPQHLVQAAKKRGAPSHFPAAQTLVGTTESREVALPNYVTLAFETVRRRTVLDRAEAFTRQLQADLAEVERCNAIMAAIIGELATPCQQGLPC